MTDGKGRRRKRERRRERGRRERERGERERGFSRPVFTRPFSLLVFTESQERSELNSGYFKPSCYIFIIVL